MEIPNKGKQIKDLHNVFELEYYKRTNYAIHFNPTRI